MVTRKPAPPPSGAAADAGLRSGRSKPSPRSRRRPRRPRRLPAQAGHPPRAGPARQPRHRTPRQRLARACACAACGGRGGPNERSGRKGRRGAGAARPRQGECGTPCARSQGRRVLRPGSAPPSGAPPGGPRGAAEQDVTGCVRRKGWVGWRGHPLWGRCSPLWGSVRGGVRVAEGRGDSARRPALHGGRASLHRPGVTAGRGRRSREE